jgi:prepilin peptidase CpaA
VLDDAYLVLWLSGGILLSLLAAATIADFARRRIPNLIVLAGLLLGVGLNALLPEGFGLFNRYAPGGLGVLAALGGVLVGGGLLLPMYALRAMGAGDVKLMAMVGAFLSPRQALLAALLVLLAGGLLSLAFAIKSGVLQRTFANLRLLFVGAFSSLLLRESPNLSVGAETAGRVPYGLAIALGTGTYLLMQYHGWIAA